MQDRAGQHHKGDPGTYVLRSSSRHTSRVVGSTERSGGNSAGLSVPGGLFGILKIRDRMVTSPVALPCMADDSRADQTGVLGRYLLLARS